MKALWLMAWLGLWSTPAAGADILMEEIADAVLAHDIAPPEREQLLRGSLEDIDELLKSFDPHAEYLSAAQYRAHKAGNRQGHSGIGAELSRQGGGIVVIPFQDGPAYRAGVRQRHYLKAIDGRSVRGRALDEVGDWVSGPPGSTVTLTIAQSPDGPGREVAVQRGAFRPRSVELVRDSGVPYLRIRDFVAHDTAVSLKVALKRLKEQGQPVILDLRDCSGGDLHEALDAASLFLPAGKILARLVSRSGSEQILRSLPARRIVTDPILLLVGPDTASSAEVFAGALQHYLRALAVGSSTYGKCTSQTFVELSDGSALKLTNLKIFSPSGRFCDGEGIRPHLQVAEDALYPTADLIAQGLARLREGFHLVCSSDTFEDKDRVSVEAMEVEVAMDTDRRQFLRLSKPGGSATLYYLCIGPLEDLDQAVRLSVEYSEALGRYFHPRVVK